MNKDLEDLAATLVNEFYHDGHFPHREAKERLKLRIATYLQIERGRGVVEGMNIAKGKTK